MPGPIPRALGACSLAGILAGGFAAPARSETVLAQYTAGPLDGGTGYVGQSLTTIAGGSYDNLRFTFYSDSGTTPSSAGNLYILNQAYLGTPAALSASTSGFVAESTSIAGGAYVFAPATSLAGGTQYFLYSDSQVHISGAAGNPYLGGQAYATNAPPAFAPTFSALADDDLNFKLTSGVVTAPIAQFSGINSVVATAYFGQSLRIASAGAFDHLTFNFFSDVDSTIPTAAGDVYILTSPYTGTPSDLGPNTTGLLAESTGSVGGVYQFAPGVALQGNTEYYFYTDASQTVSGTGGDQYLDGAGYEAQPPAIPAFTAGNGESDVNFNLSGLQMQAAGPPAGVVPTPETLSLLGIGLASAAVMRRRRG